VGLELLAEKNAEAKLNERIAARHSGDLALPRHEKVTISEIVGDYLANRRGKRSIRTMTIHAKPLLRCPECLRAPRARYAGSGKKRDAARYRSRQEAARGAFRHNVTGPGRAAGAFSGSERPAQPVLSMFAPFKWLSLADRRLTL
jgi:hypothetical protein